MKTYDFTKSYELFDRAIRVIPNGIPVPRTPHFLTFGEFPAFIARGEGSHVWDVDGNEFIDFMCAYGPIALGYNNPAVEDAVAIQKEKGDEFTLPGPLWVELAEKLVDLAPMADWAMFGKNGSDVTTYANRIARVHTGRDKIVVADHAYHGFHDWCVPSPVGVPQPYRQGLPVFNYNDMDDLERVFHENSGEIAGLMLTPVRHDALADQELPADGFFKKARELCDKEGALFIMDDVRCGFRYDIRGSHEYFGADPDIVCFGKAMSNGYTLSAALGRGDIKESASKVYFSATHFSQSVPLAAAMATIDEMKRIDAIKTIWKRGKQLQDGLKEQAQHYGFNLNVSGAPPMPFIVFSDDPTFSMNRLFCGRAARRGVFFHPHHNWFLSAAHTEEDIDRALEVSDECFKIMREENAAPPDPNEAWG